MKILRFCSLLLLAVSVSWAEPAGSIVGVVGTAELNPVRQAGWKPARIGETTGSVGAFER